MERDQCSRLASGGSSVSRRASASQLPLTCSSSAVQVPCRLMRLLTIRQRCSMHKRVSVLASAVVCCPMALITRNCSRGLGTVDIGFLKNELPTRTLSSAFRYAAYCPCLLPGVQPSVFLL